MTRVQRRVHLCVWSLLGLALLAAVVFAWQARVPSALAGSSDAAAAGLSP
ncbi:MAG: hypothetical protein AAF747_06065 [Planctomycetota bacterium]